MKVKIQKGKDGNNFITQSPNNPEFGWMFVEQEVNEFNNGWLRKVKRSARVMGKVADFINSGFKPEMELPGKIVIIESLNPFNAENPDKDLKIAGKSGVICRYDDQPIYRISSYTTNLNTEDELISHTNTDEIREVLEAQKLMSTLTVAEPNL